MSKPNLIAANSGEEPIIQAIAEEIAGQFHTQSSDRWSDDPERSARFRDTYPNTDDYIRGYMRCVATFAPILNPDTRMPVDPKYFRVEGSDRWWKIGVPGWQYFAEIAVKRAAQMLNEPTTSKYEKRQIELALKRRFKKATAPEAVSLLQRRPAGVTQLN